MRREIMPNFAILRFQKLGGFWGGFWGSYHRKKKLHCEFTVGHFFTFNSQKRIQNNSPLWLERAKISSINEYSSVFINSFIFCPQRIFANNWPVVWQLPNGYWHWHDPCDRQKNRRGRIYEMHAPPLSFLTLQIEAWRLLSRTSEICLNIYFSYPFLCPSPTHWGGGGAT